MSIIELMVSLAAILGAAVLFTNAVEILGDRLGLGHGAVGSILAAVGTALPETMIPIVAILGAVIVGSGGAAAGEIGIGAILGAPFLLATLALFIVGVAAIGYKGRRSSGSDLVAHREIQLTDMVFFLICFTLATGAGVINLPLVLKMGFGAHIFVDAVGHISTAIGIPAGLIALVLAPLATELPEKFNSVIWLRDNKDTLALGNITGAMVFQSTIPVSVGILFTPWNLGFLSVLSAAFALISGVVFIGFLLRKGPLRGFYLLGAGILYAAFLVAATVVIVGS